MAEEEGAEAGAESGAEAGAEAEEEVLLLLRAISSWPQRAAAAAVRVACGRCLHPMAWSRLPPHSWSGASAAVTAAAATAVVLDPQPVVSAGFAASPRLTVKGVGQPPISPCVPLPMDMGLPHISSGMPLPEVVDLPSISAGVPLPDPEAVGLPSISAGLPLPEVVGLPLAGLPPFSPGGRLHPSATNSRWTTSTRGWKS